MLRGGSWNNNPRNVRASNRNRNEPENRNNNIGFRCARDVERRLMRFRGESHGGPGCRESANLHFRTALPTRALSASNTQMQPGPVVAQAAKLGRVACFTREVVSDGRRPVNKSGGRKDQSAGVPAYRSRVGGGWTSRSGERRVARW